MLWDFSVFFFPAKQGPENKLLAELSQLMLSVLRSTAQPPPAPWICYHPLPPTQSLQSHHAQSHCNFTAALSGRNHSNLSLSESITTVLCLLRGH